METSNIFSNPDTLKVLAQIVAYFAVVGAILLLTEFGVIRPLARIYWQFRGQVKAVVELVDEPTDNLIVQLGKITPIPASVWAAFLPVFLGALATGLDAALKQPPAPELKISAGWVSTGVAQAVAEEANKVMDQAAG